MYSVYADGVCIYNDAFALDNMKLASPKLTLEDNAAGSFVMTVPPSNLGYSTIIRMVTDIAVHKDGKEIWAGRVLSENEDFYRNRVLTCEGELAFFNDSTQPPAEYAGGTIREYLEAMIAVHNAKVGDNRKFTIGIVTVVDEDFPTYYTNYEKTITILNALVAQYGGHLRVRKEDGIRYLDYLADYPDTCSQTIQFGSNLIEHTKGWDMTEFATVIVPLGNRLDKSEIEALDAYLTVESVNEGSLYVQSSEAVKTYGWIEKTVTWDSVSDPEALLEKAKAYLADLQFDNMELEVSALDLHYLNANVEAVKLLDEIRVISRPHGLDRVFPVTKLEIPLDSPENTKFTLGDTVQTSLTSVNNQISAAIIEKIEGLPKAHNILKEAKENATQIMTAATTGYITITRDEYGSDTLYISNIRDYTKADKLWKWNMNGLGYSKDYGKTFGLAITMDGSIVADYITTGVLNADVIRAGTLKDYGGNFSLDFEIGKLTMKKGSIDIGDGNFTVDEEGNLTARRGTFAGTLAAAKGTFSGTLVGVDGNFKGVVQASDFLDRAGNSMMDDERFKSKYLSIYGLTVTNGVRTTFAVDSSGSVTIDGKVTLSAGSTINWASVTNQNLTSNPAYSLASTANANAATAKSAADDAYDEASAAWSRANKAYQDRCTDQNVFDVLTSGGTKFGIFSDSYSGRLYINADYIRSGTINADYIDLSCDYGGFCKGHGSDGQHTTYGAMMYGSNGPGWEPYIIVTNAGARISGSGADLVVSGSITMSEEPSYGSDLRIKNSIDYDLASYEAFFLALKPSTFKYNKGTSGRTHFGFIAQDVEQAMVDSGLTADQLAALVKDPVQQILEDGITDYRYSIRYGELIALNTHMIQKLYQMVEELLQQKEG